MKLAILSATLLVLTGCAEYRARMEAERQAQQAALNRQDDAQCRDYGAQPGTQVYTECRMLIATQRQNIEAVQDMQRRQNSMELLAISAGMMSGR